MPKSFRYPLGHTAIETLTVADLIAALGKYPPDMPVLATWETVRSGIRESSFEVAPHHSGKKEDECMALIIDVEQP